MPELPEVENILLTHKKIIGLTIKEVVVLYENIVRPNQEQFIKLVKNEKVIELKRYGKVLFILLQNSFITVSFRMEGRFYYSNEILTDKHIHLYLKFDNDYYLYYKDTRKFGKLRVYDISQLDDVIGSIKEEIFDISVSMLYSRLNNKNIPIKSLLLDQQIVSGIGNIYADEILYKSKINPFKKGGLISMEEVSLIIENGKTILNESIKKGGSTIKSFESGLHQSGSYQDSLLVYGKEHELCPICHNEFIKKKISGRGTTFCPLCQKRKTIVGITGNQASGKSYILKILNKLGCKTVSSDSIVKDLYNSIEVKEQLSKQFNLDINSNLKSEISNLILNSPSNIKKLNFILHPYIFEAIKSIIYLSTNDLIFIEIPLLFETKFNKLVDKIIIVSASDTLRLSRLKDRNSNLTLLLDSYQLDKESLLDKGDYIIKSGLSDEVLLNEVERIIDDCREI